MTLQFSVTPSHDRRLVVTHQHSGDPAIHYPFIIKQNVVVTHQHSGDPAMLAKIDSELSQTVVTHQHSGDPAIIMKNSDLVMIGRNSPTFW